MGGRGASSGGRHLKNGTYLPYGSEYTCVYQSGNIKFVLYKGSSAAKAPLETMTKGRVYVTVTEAGELKYITYYDSYGKRVKQIDLDRPHHGVVPHTHHGYEHNENDTAKGFSNLTTQEKKLVERAKEIWHNRRSSKT